MFLWWWALDEAADGNLADISDATIAEQCLWTGDAKAFVAALVTSRFVTPDRAIHHWHEYTDKFIAGRESNRKRQQDFRLRKGVTRDKPVTSRKRNAATVTVTVTDTSTNVKNKYGEFKNVELTDAELEKLNTRFGKDKAFALIETLSGGIESKGYKYRSCYAAILNWERNDRKREATNGTNKKDTRQLTPRAGYTRPEDYTGKR